MFKIFRAYIDSKGNLTDEDFDRIQSVSVLKKLRKNQYLLQEGDVWKYHAFVIKGCLRMYAVDTKGLERITYFAIENWWIGDRESLLSGKPSRFNIDAIEDSEVLLISKPDYETICKEIPAFRDLNNMILDNSLAATQNRIYATISFTAEEKYLHFLSQCSHLANRIPLHMIASFLGVTAETLSRIRKQVAGK